MASTSTPLTPDELSRFNQGDEAALERMFRVEYDSLVASASAELDDAAAAPRIVEGAFYQAWQQRAGFAHMGDLVRFLKDAIHREALLERGRRASLQRFHEHEGAARPRDQLPPATASPASVDEAWAALAAALHRPADVSEAGAARRRDASRHGAASHMARVGATKRDYRSLFLVVIVAAVVIGGIYTAMRFMGAGDPGRRVDAELERGDPRMVVTRSGQRANVPLADGSTASLGPDTQLRIATEYGKSMRTLGLVGTATFRVTESDQPFFVRAGAARIRATGTLFDVSTFDSAGTIVRVREGAVSVTSGGSTQNLAVGEAVAVSADSSMSTPAAGALDEALGWTDGQFVMVDRPMSDIPAYFMRWYGVQVAVADSNLLDRRVTVRASLDSTRGAVSALEEAGQARYTSRAGERIFLDAAAAPATPAATRRR